MLNRAGMRELYVGVCGPAVKGGPDGPYRFEVRSSFRFGPVLYVKLKVTAPHLARPYFLSDAFGTRCDKLVMVLSTFDGTNLVFKKRPRILGAVPGRSDASGGRGAGGWTSERGLRRSSEGSLCLWLKSCSRVATDGRAGLLAKRGGE